MALAVGQCGPVVLVVYLRHPLMDSAELLKEFPSADIIYCGRR